MADRAHHGGRRGSSPGHRGMPPMPGSCSVVDRARTLFRSRSQTVLVATDGLRRPSVSMDVPLTPCEKARSAIASTPGGKRSSSRAPQRCLRCPTNRDRANSRITPIMRRGPLFRPLPQAVSSRTSAASGRCRGLRRRLISCLPPGSKHISALTPRHSLACLA